MPLQAGRRVRLGVLLAPLILTFPCAPDRAAAAPDATSLETACAATLEKMTRAVNAGDAAGYASLYTPDAVITIFGTTKLEGRPAIETYERDLLSQFPGARLGFHAIWQKGAEAAVHYAVAGGTPAGKTMGHEGLLFYRFDPSGLILEEHRYLDSLTPMAQMGALGDVPSRPPPPVPDRPRNHRANGSDSEMANAALARATLAALDANDQARFLSGFAGGAVWDEMIETQPLGGRQALETWSATWGRAIPGARREIRNLLAIGDFVLLETTVEGTLKSRLGRVPPSDAPLAFHQALAFEISSGKVQKVVSFMNGKELAQAAGRWPLPADR